MHTAILHTVSATAMMRSIALEEARSHQPRCESMLQMLKLWKLHACWKLECPGPGDYKTVECVHRDETEMIREG